ncbi:MAG TPA: MBL fold metallo-hydrolase [bacterium]|nr:MBL fold metallo-hydrolase [bacterium]
MKLNVLASGSRANCYIIENDSEALIIECGVSFNKVKEAMNFNISKIIGCLVSHEHKDHSGYVNDFLKANIPVYMSEGTKKQLNLNIETTCNTDVFNIGTFKIKPLHVKHDALEPLGFLINHKETGTILFATDCSSIPYRFTGLNNIMIECNHSVKIVEEKLHKGLINEAQSIRILRSHISLETCLYFLSETDLSKVNNIVLLHLSDNNSDAEHFKKVIENKTHKNVYIAEKGLIIDFNKIPF